jgi:hypothetical protein
MTNSRRRTELILVFPVGAAGFEPTFANPPDRQSGFWRLVLNDAGGPW